MSFDYSMSADGSQAVAESVKVEQSLSKVEQHAVKVGKAMTDAWDKGAAAAKKAEFAIESMGVSTRDFEAALTRINAPMDKLEKDMRVLNALQASGAISARQYADELARIGKEHGLTGTQHGLGAVSLPEIPKADGGLPKQAGEVIEGIGGKLMGMVGPAAAAGIALKTITEALDNWKQRRQDVDDATNSILKFHDSIETAKAAMEEQKQLSTDLNINITKTAHAYAAVREATEDLGLSSKEMTDITRNLTASLIVDGGSIEGVAAIMEKLQYANETGILSQRELKAIWKDSPEVIHSFEKSLNVTYPQLMKMAAEGKLTGAALEKMTKGIGQGHEAIDKYKERLQSIDAVMADQHVSWAAAVRMIVEAKEAYQEAAETGPEMMERIGKATQHTYDVTEKLVDKLNLIMTLARSDGAMAANKNTIDTGFKAQAAIDGLRTPWEKYRDTVDDTTKTLTKAGIKAEDIARQIGRIHPPGWVDYYKQELDSIRQPEIDWQGRLHALNQLLKEKRITLDEYGDAFVKAYASSPKAIEFQRQLTAAAAAYKDEIARIIELKKSGVDTAPGISITDALKGGTLSQASSDAKAAASVLGPAQDKGMADAADIEKRAQMIVQKYDMASTALTRYHEALIEIATVENSMDEATGQRLRNNAQLKYWREAGQEAQKAAAQMKKAHSTALAAEEQFKSSVGSLSDTLVDAANGADVSWGKFFKNMLVEMEKAILKAELLSLIGNSGLNGGASSGILGAAANSIIGMASGGTYTAPNTGGGQDSIPVVFRMNPGESAHFTNQGSQFPSQYNGGPRGGWNNDAGGGGAMYMTIAPQMYNERALLQAVQGPYGQRVISQMVRQSMGPHIRSLA